MLNHQTKWRLALLAAASIFIFGIVPASTQRAASGSQPDYLDPSLPVDQRVNDLVSRMTMEEKASQMVNTAAWFMAGPLSGDRTIFRVYVTGPLEPPAWPPCGGAPGPTLPPGPPCCCVIGSPS